jgi:hypothetical protein
VAGIAENMPSELGVVWVADDWLDELQRATAEIEGDGMRWGIAWVADDGEVEVELDDAAGEEVTVRCDELIAGLKKAALADAPLELIVAGHVFGHIQLQGSERVIQLAGPYHSHLSFRLNELIDKLDGIQAELTQWQHNMNERAATTKD